MSNRGQKLLPLPAPATRQSSLALDTDPWRCSGNAAPPPLTRMAPFAALLAAASTETRMPFWLLAAMVAQESNFDPRALSPAGAIGLMQIMPATARDCGLDPSQLWDPGANIHWGARILASNYEIFQQEAPEERLRFALAAYNGGAETVLAAQELAVRRKLNPHVWASLDQVLPGVTLGPGQSPLDYRQVQTYVRSIWRRYQAWGCLPLPPEASGESAARTS